MKLNQLKIQWLGKPANASVAATAPAMAGLPVAVTKAPAHVPAIAAARTSRVGRFP